jgi:hypothetical protein
MKTNYLYIILILFLLSCNKSEKVIDSSLFPDDKNKELIIDQTVHGGYIDYRFLYVDEIGIIDGFDGYFVLKNNILMGKESLIPFDGKIVLNVNMDYDKIVRELYFLNGFLYQEEQAYYDKYGTISSKIKYNVFSFFDQTKRMKYYYHDIEHYSYYDIAHSTIENNLKYSRIMEGEVPGGLYKVTNYTTTGEIKDEGYYQWLNVPVYADYIGQVGFEYKFAKLGVWKYYSGKYSERIWGLKNIIVEDIETYKFNED